MYTNNKHAAMLEKQNLIQVILHTHTPILIMALLPNCALETYIPEAVQKI